MNLILKNAKCDFIVCVTATYFLQETCPFIDFSVGVHNKDNITFI